jgi:hypothetical protein
MSQPRLRRKKQPIKGDRSRRVTAKHTCNESTQWKSTHLPLQHVIHPGTSTCCTQITLAKRDILNEIEHSSLHMVPPFVQPGPDRSGSLVSSRNLGQARRCRRRFSYGGGI